MKSTIFRHTSSNSYIGEEKEYYQEEVTKWAREDFKSNGWKHPGALLLDSSLISQSQYDYKIIECGKYVQVYQYLNKKTSQKDKKEKTLLDYDYLFTKKENIHSQDKKYIMLKNVNRSKFQLQRIVKANEEVFKTFITLTFEDEIYKDIELANKKFNIWRRNIKRLKSDFKYVCVPEYQKRGVVHYHLLTNIDYNDFSLLSKEERHIYNKKSGWQIGRDIKGWIYGLNMAKKMDNINVVTYITKYMTKDIDNRLWGKRKYLYSMNLNRPKEALIDNERPIEYSKLFTVEALYDLQYQKVYYDKLGEPIFFREFKLT